MNWQRELGTFLVVTAVTVLIWVWAAAETREENTIRDARLDFTVADSGAWMVEPAQRLITLKIEGSKLALENVEARLREAIPLSVNAAAGRTTIDLLERLRAHELFGEAGVNVVSVEPATIEIELDPIERVTARVKPTLPGVTPEGEIVVEPREVTLRLPSRLRQRFPQATSVEAAIDRAELQQLEPGRPHTLAATLRLPEGLAGAAGVSVEPAKATVTFTIRSRIREVHLDSVRVHLAGPPEDRETFIVEIDPKQLRDVTVFAEADLAQLIASNEAPVVAMLHLSSREKEMRIASKPISMFVALVTDANGSTRTVEVKANVAGAAELPVIALDIRDR